MLTHIIPFDPHKTLQGSYYHIHCVQRRLPKPQTVGWLAQHPWEKQRQSEERAHGLSLHTVSVLVMNSPLLPQLFKPQVGGGVILWPSAFNCSRIFMTCYSTLPLLTKDDKTSQARSNTRTVLFFCAGGLLSSVGPLSEFTIKSPQELLVCGSEATSPRTFFLKSPFLLVISDWGERCLVTCARIGPISLILTGIINVLTAFGQRQGEIGSERTFKKQKAIKMYFTSVIFLPKPIVVV